MEYSSIQYESLVNATYRILAGGIACSVFVIAYYALYPPQYKAYAVSGYYALTVLGGLRVYAYFAPKNRTLWIASALKFVFLTTFIPLTWYFVIGAWMGEWRLVDSFPPITAFIIVTSIVVLTLLHTKTAILGVGVSWLVQAFPVLSYLVFHLDELLSPRGIELLVAFGPTSFFIFVIIPHQKELYFKYQQLSTNISRAMRDADRDSLTDLLNRRGVERWINAMPLETSVAVILADVDHFQHLNEVKGYEAGDRALVEIASRLRVVYDGPFRLARWAGETFLIVLINPDQERIKNEADTFRRALDSIPYKEELGHHVTLSLGVSRISGLSDFSLVLKEAEEAMRFSIRNGRNRTSFYSQMDEKSTYSSE
ncbi:GGDEF domain-containing protein [Marinomonas balearica]|uniref:diguanylate cyclase n=1 Tax=Marinomonas balearica TaxID=491947 RepID=A0A4V3CGD1_9GAMM|nr:GGDEF domain-containing protein [Marinomonas balearica]TDO97262.1 diguanylate cyclase (GGDEF)-like protein [Marinomonas balearica]